MALPILGILDTGLRLIDKLYTSDEEKAEAKLKLVTLEQEGAFKEMDAAMQAMMAEAKSEDPWTSRARPSFLYVIYILILSSIPMGIMYAIVPDTAAEITTGFQNWLAAIPEPYLQLFGIGYLGYAGARSWDKSKRQGKS